MPGPRTDLIILGGGLAGGLLALALAKRQPAMTVTIVEAGEAIGGNHLWSFFDGDVTPKDRWLVDPLIVHRWTEYDVRFPAFTRTIAEGYQSIESERLDAAVRAALPADAIIRGVVECATPTKITLANGGSLHAHKVIDMRGAGDLSALACGWQKFVGRRLTLDQPHGLDRPVVMDATIAQLDGYRFVYLLPFGDHDLFVEDTYYSDTAELDVAQLDRRIDDYVDAKGWRVASESRRETGVLPVVMAGDFDRYWPRDDAVARGGVRAGLFQPLTSYSLPDAVRFAIAFASDPALDARAYASAHWRRGRFARLLARMLFRAAAPAERFRVLERFYRLPDALIARFYAGRSTLADRARILAGKPPVPLHHAVAAMVGAR